MSVAMEEGPRRHRITVEEYYRMAEVGLLAPDARVELIEGEIIHMPPIGSPHAAFVTKLRELLTRAIGERALIRCQFPVRLSEISEPQPDLAVVVRRADFYEKAHPSAVDTLLAVEVGDSTVQYDLSRKQSLYAAHGIREYWVIDVQRQRLHIFRRPATNGYEDATCVEKADIVSISALPGVTVDLSSLIPWSNGRESPQSPGG